jgi:CO/xanthine dehydrogenase FAD-binding subunit
MPETHNSEPPPFMKPAPFEYSRPADIDQACAILAADDGARVIAGGQTLVPMMAMRLARPTRLVDIGRLSALSFIREESGTVLIGATTRQRTVERDPFVAAKAPLLAKAMPFVGHAPTRARGTVGGSLANADPAAEIVLVAVTLGATLIFRGNGQDDGIAAADFFIGPMITALPAGNCLTAVCFPIWPERRVGVGFHEINARRSDFAFVSAAAQVALTEEGLCQRLAVGVGAATDVPLRLDAVADALVGTPVEPDAVRAAVRYALADIDPMSDLHASADYRRRVAATLAVRAIADAVQAARAPAPADAPAPAGASAAARGGHVH